MKPRESFFHRHPLSPCLKNTGNSFSKLHRRIRERRVSFRILWIPPAVGTDCDHVEAITGYAASRGQRGRSDRGGQRQGRWHSAGRPRRAGAREEAGKPPFRELSFCADLKILARAQSLLKLLPPVTRREYPDQFSTAACRGPVSPARTDSVRFRAAPGLSKWFTEEVHPHFLAPGVSAGFASGGAWRGRCGAEMYLPLCKARNGQPYSHVNAFRFPRKRGVPTLTVQQDRKTGAFALRNETPEPK